MLLLHQHQNCQCFHQLFRVSDSNERNIRCNLKICHNLHASLSRFIAAFIPSVYTEVLSNAVDAPYPAAVVDAPYPPAVVAPEVPASVYGPRKILHISMSLANNFDLMMSFNSVSNSTAIVPETLYIAPPAAPALPELPAIVQSKWENFAEFICNTRSQRFKGSKPKIFEKSFEKTIRSVLM